MHAQLIQDAIAFATSKKQAYPNVDTAELAVEVMMVKLALRIVPHLKGYSHIQTNTNYSYSKQKTIENGQRKTRFQSSTISPTHNISWSLLIPNDWNKRHCRNIQGAGPDV